jgi:hypothetical protein
MKHQLRLKKQLFATQERYLYEARADAEAKIERRANNTVQHNKMAALNASLL